MPVTTRSASLKLSVAPEAEPQQLSETTLAVGTAELSGSRKRRAPTIDPEEDKHDSNDDDDSEAATEPDENHFGAFEADTGGPVGTVGRTFYHPPRASTQRSESQSDRLPSPPEPSSSRHRGSATILPPKRVRLHPRQPLSEFLLEIPEEIDPTLSSNPLDLERRSEERRPVYDGEYLKIKDMLRRRVGAREGRSGRAGFGGSTGRSTSMEPPFKIYEDK
ncbi:hypothetical protein BJ508DRAFT_313076 [Ascobolus immersus RN42]|uniref:Uncharacterized protein n=1 Tax=Ascobolus immersus RN42 TaxID=1160509 RepID=A0A3N4HQC1_ASCIM|nr:hypothetical protein BJ508DRAFT_313076 [Ascobolus immersus RN42]